jgi:hypothetical protein
MSRQQHVNGRFVAVKGIHHIQGHPSHVVAPRGLDYGVAPMASYSRSNSHRRLHNVHHSNGAFGAELGKFRFSR